MTKLKERIREITSRNGGRSLACVAAELRSHFTGWKAYFRLADTPGVWPTWTNGSPSPAYVDRQTEYDAVSCATRKETFRASGHGRGGAQQAMVGDVNAWCASHGISDAVLHYTGCLATRSIITSTL
ncbi:group II intron maturase-specific domain-containing protein [Gemmatimonas sp.]|uniref:group II intron maturase-specific domain-containing protein n=1 Tax=Gemmatimonas sp. TaxID=1962908 RepID=UPI00356672DF